MTGRCTSVINRWRSLALISWIAWGVACPPVTAEGVRGLQEIYGTPIPTEIRRGFDQTLGNYTACPECVVTVLDGERFLPIYPKKFLVVGMEPNGFGGVWAVIAVEGELRNSFLLWLYDLGEHEYQLRSIEELPNSLDENLIRQLSTPAYRRYWL